MPAEASSSSAANSPLLVFINMKSGERQGSTLYKSLLQWLNEQQIFTLDEGGALAGLYAFRKVARFRILICGGDGTVGWVLSHLEQVQPHLVDKQPPVGIVPMGTGNDLARMLGWGPGWADGDGVNSLLNQVVEAETVEMDRWNIIFDEDRPQVAAAPLNAHAADSRSETNSDVI